MTGTVDFAKFNGPKIICCSVCDKDIKAINTQTEWLTGNRIGYFFSCDQCGHKYPFAAISEKGQQLLKKMEKRKKDIRKNPALAKNLNFALRQDLIAYRNEVESSYNEEDVLDEQQAKGRKCNNNR